MANLESSKKQDRQNQKHRIKNLKRKTAIKTAIKKVVTGIDNQMDLIALTALLNDAQAQLARAINKNTIHRNTARRKISNLAKKVAQATSHKK